MIAEQINITTVSLEHQCSIQQVPASVRGILSMNCVECGHTKTNRRRRRAYDNWIDDDYYIYLNAGQRPLNMIYDLGTTEEAFVLFGVVIRTCMPPSSSISIAECNA